MAVPSQSAGKGAILTPAGAAFRVWAPNASAVSVAGDFNGWDADANPLAREEGGWWSADIEGPHDGTLYKYVIRNGDRLLWRVDPYAAEVTEAMGETILRSQDYPWPEASFTMPPWEDLVLYEIHIGTFFDEPGGPPGNIEEVISRLDYLRDLGITAIELMPAMEFPEVFSWGYDPSHLFAIESEYGGPRAFKKLVAEAHQRGIAVIFDVVYNHFGPNKLDLYQFDGWSEWDMGGIYFYQDWRSWTPWGARNRPDYGRPEVRAYIRDNAIRWLEEFRVDGLRWDATSYIRNVQGGANRSSDIPDGWRLMQSINEEIKSRQPWKISIAEDLQNNDWIVQDTALGGAGFDAQWSSVFVHTIRQALSTAWDQDRQMGAVAAAIGQRSLGDALRRVIYTESHDEVANGRARVPQEVDPQNPGSWLARKRTTLGAAVVFTAPGIPMIMQGQEFLEDEYFRDTDPLDWTKLYRYAGIHQLFRDLIRLRRNQDGTSGGLRGHNVNVFHVNHWDKVIAFHRWKEGGAGDDVVVVANFANRAYDSYRLGFPGGGWWKVRFNSDAACYSLDFSAQPGYDTFAEAGTADGLDYSANVGIGPYSVLILSQ